MEPTINNTNTMKFLEKRVLGFDDGNSIFMTFKELVDNATDACINTVDAQIYIEINDCDGYEIIISDNGHGLDPSSIESIGILFSSIKSNNYSLGRFGLGLKSILQCSKHISFITKTNNNSGISFKLTLDDTYQPYVYNVKETFICDWSTVITVFINSYIDINIVFNSILGYIKMLSFLHQEINYTIQHTGNRRIYHMAEKSHLEKVSAFINEIIVISQINTTTDYNNKYNISDGIDITAGLFNEKVECRYGNCVIFTSINGMPLLSKYSKSCSIYGGFNKFIENQGHEFGIFHSPKVSLNFDSGLENVASIINVKLPEDRKWANLFMFINVNNSDPKYGDLAKTHIKNMEIEEKVNISCMNVMTQLKTQVGKYELESQSDYKTRMGLFYSKQLSHNIVNILNYSNDEFRERIHGYLKSSGINTYNNNIGLEIVIEKKIKSETIYLV